MDRPTQTASRKRARWPFIVAAPFAILAAVGLWIVIGLAVASDPYAFLNGRRPILAGVALIIQDSGYRSKGFTDEYRAYSWQADYVDVCRRANGELTAIGFVRDPGDMKYEFATCWRRPDGFGVMITPVRSRTRREALAGKSPLNMAWVTVLCTDPIPDTWVSHVRYAMESRDY